MSFFSEQGLREVINASGKMTALGGSAVSENVAEALKQGSLNYVIMEELLVHCGEVISKNLGSEDGCITNSASAGITISVATSITGDNLSLIERMPDSEGLKNEIILQKGHAVNFGANITQMIRIGGGKAVEVGTANMVVPDHIEQAITDKTAALFYVKSHHAVQEGMVSLDVMIEIAKKHGLPVIVDCAAEEDFKKYVRSGADFVIFSGAKALEGATSGLICGSKKNMSACRKQYKGIGRAMKIGKECIAAFLVAMDRYGNMDGASNKANEQRMAMEELCKKLNELKGIESSIMRDDAGREIYRAKIKINKEVTGISALELKKKLESGNPAIFLREHFVDLGILAIDPRPLLKGQDIAIFEQIKKVLEEQH